MSEELFDKYLSNTLTATEEEELHDLLQDDTQGEALVEYALEIYTNTKTANDIINGNTSKERKDLIRQHQEPVPIAKYLGIAASLAAAIALIFWVSRPVEEIDAEVSRVGEKANVVHGGKFQEGDTIKTDELTHFEFLDGSKIKLEGEILVVNDSKIVLKSGSLSMNVVPRENSELIIETDNAEVAVLGTVFTVSKNRVDTAVEVSEGKVRLSSNGSYVELNRGFAASTYDGKIIKSKKGLKHVNYLIYRKTIESDRTLKLYAPMENTNPLEALGFPADSTLNTGQFVNGRTPFTRALKNGILEIPGTENFSLDMPCTIGAWVNVSDFENYPPILTKGDNAWRVQMNVNGKRFHLGFGDNKQFINSKKFIETGKWYFVTFVGTHDKVQVYVNGRLENEKEINSFNFRNDSTIMIGGNKTVPERSFTGLIGNTFILQRNLSSQEVIDLYNFGLGSR